MMYEIGSANDDEARMSEIGRAFGEMARMELSRSNDGETMNSVWQDIANCRTEKSAADYRQSPNSILNRTLDAHYYKEKPETQHFMPKMESPVSLELTMEAASLANKARRVVAGPMPDIKALHSKDTPEYEKSKMLSTGETLKFMRDTIKRNSPADVSTMLTLANKLLDKSGIQFVYNDEGYVDLQPPDGSFIVLAKPKNPRWGAKA